jgi:hypothetical protein
MLYFITKNMESDLIQNVMTRTWSNWAFYWSWILGLYDLEKGKFNYLTCLLVIVLTFLLD